MSHAADSLYRLLIPLLLIPTSTLVASSDTPSSATMNSCSSPPHSLSKKPSATTVSNIFNLFSSVLKLWRRQHKEEEEKEEEEDQQEYPGTENAKRGLANTAREHLIACFEENIEEILSSFLLQDDHNSVILPTKPIITHSLRAAWLLAHFFNFISNCLPSFPHAGATMSSCFQILFTVLHRASKMFL